jgi:hypothetical protein
MHEAKAKGIEIVMPVDFACPSKFGEDGDIPAGVMDPRSGHEKSSTREGTPQLRSTEAYRHRRHRPGRDQQEDGRGVG